MEHFMAREDIGRCPEEGEDRSRPRDGSKGGGLLATTNQAGLFWGRVLLTLGIGSWRLPDHTELRAQVAASTTLPNASQGPQAYH